MLRLYTDFGAGNETRTRDPNLGKVVLYQLSYSRVPSEGRDCKCRACEVKVSHSAPELRPRGPQIRHHRDERGGRRDLREGHAHAIDGYTEDLHAIEHHREPY